MIDSRFNTCLKARANRILSPIHSELRLVLRPRLLTQLGFLVYRLVVCIVSIRTLGIVVSYNICNFSVLFGFIWISVLYCTNLYIVIILLSFFLCRLALLILFLEMTMKSEKNNSLTFGHLKCIAVFQFFFSIIPFRYCQ